MFIRKHTIFPEEFPEAWASDWGEDEFGLWMAFTYKGVRQAFRWCEPGTFLMGSPEDEAERREDELQHEVTLTKGFWIADTPVSRVLWHMVMGMNPGRFQGEINPIDKVSWEDAQKFIAKMNGLKAELKLCLPTEAQWEYACRAGTDTSFFCGDQIDSNLVNCNGSYPYDGDRKIGNMPGVIGVKDLPCNDWGLYQMHGNVWEWCQDWYGQYSLNSVTDPQGPSSGTGRVLRGGSWYQRDRYCRSAFRLHNVPTKSYYNFGFRLARNR